MLKYYEKNYGHNPSSCNNPADPDCLNSILNTQHQMHHIQQQQHQQSMHQQYSNEHLIMSPKIIDNKKDEIIEKAR
jgi:hypothetical protein